MKFLRRFWPLPFLVKRTDVISLILNLVVFLAACTVVGLLIGLLAHIWIIGIVFGLIGGLLELYSVIGIVLCFLVFLGILQGKQEK